MAQFNFLIFIIITIATLSSFWWLKSADSKLRNYLLPFVIFTFIYSGIGAAWDTCDSNYTFWYCYFLVVFSLTIRYFTSRTRNNVIPSRPLTFIDKHGRGMLISYILLCLISLALEGKLGRIFSPPTLDMDGAIDESFNGSAKGAFAQLIYYFKNIFYTFYIVSLYKYRDNFIKFSALLLFPVYLNFVSVAYIGRGTLMLNIIILVIEACLCYPHRKKLILRSIFVLSPIAIVFLSWYTFYRQGHSFNLDFGQSLNYLLYSETRYPEHYTIIKSWNEGAKLAWDYVEWIVTLPMPGFIRTTTTDFGFNFIFSEKIGGIDRGTMGFSVYLPGVVNEGLFIFGKVLFPLHAFIYGFIISKIYKWLKESNEMYLLLYCSVVGAYSISRAGTTAMYSYYLKSLLIYILFMYIINNKRKKI